MFDLEQEISRWRTVMSARLPLCAEAIDELEAHLRDAVQKRMSNGEGPCEAWAASVVELGSPEAIAAEYGKLPPRALWRWPPAKVVVGTYVLFAACLAGFIGARIWGDKADGLLASHVFLITVGYTALFAVGAVAGWSILSRAIGGWSPTETTLLRGVLRRLTVVSLALSAAGVVLGGIWAREHWGRFWGWDDKEIAALVLLATSGVMLRLLAKGRDERVDMLLGLAGSAMVAACWFIPTFAPKPGLNAYDGASTIWACLMGLMMLKTVLFGLVFVPPGRLRLWRA